MKEKKRVLFAACLLTVLLFGILTIQAMTETRVTNPVHTGVVDIDLSEYQVNEKGEEELWQDNPTVLPGMTISKIPRISNLGYDCYVRAKMDFDIEGMDQSYQELGEGWFLGEDGYYYCKKVLHHGDSTDIFQSIKIPEDFPQELEETQFHLDIKADAIQSKNFTPDFESKQPWGTVEIQDCQETGPYEINTVTRKDALQVVYQGESKKLFADPDNFFVNFSDVMPGDTYQDQARGNFLLEEQEEFIQAANRIREEKGYLDVPSEKNEVYYDFYLSFDCEERLLKFIFTVHNSEADDYKEYNLPIENESQQKMLLWKVIENLCSYL